jgi:hypothetical protein
VEFILLSCGVTDPSALDVLHSRGVHVFSAAVRSLVQKSLESSGGGLERKVYADLFEFIRWSRAHGGTGQEWSDIPLFSVYSAFEDSVLRIHSEGFECLVSGDPPDLDILAEVVIDPLRESSWGLGTRERKIRAYSRLARVCREVGETILAGDGIEFYARFFPPMPMTHTVKYWVKK